jgi:hypothetical protein
MFLDDDDIFGGSPEKKYFDIMFNANQNLVGYYMTKNLEKIIALENMLKEHVGEDADINQLVLNYKMSNQDLMEHELTNAYIADMGDIVSQNE